MSNFKSIIKAKTNKGYTHDFLCPTKEMHDEVSEQLTEKGWQFLNMYTLKNDAQYFSTKFSVRVSELIRTINSYDLLKSQDLPDSTKDIISHSLLDSIYSQISIILGMVRRSEKKGYHLDADLLDCVREQIDDFCERSDY